MSIDDDSLLDRFTQARRHMNGSFRSQQAPAVELALLSSGQTAFAMAIFWDELLEHYCQRSITKLSDRLPAFSGIARACSNDDVFGDYVAGLWARLFLPLMLWYIEPEKSPKLERPSEEDSPLASSWSWASVRGAWHYRRIRRSEPYAVATYYEAEPTVHDQDLVFGAVKRGVVTIKGYLGTASIQYEPLCPECQQDPELTYADRFQAQKVELVVDAECVEMWPDFVLADVQNPISSGEQVYCLFVQGNSESEPRVTQGLVLRVDEGDPTLFSRIGVFQSHVWFASSEPVEVTIC
jgi:hypothetical protein